QEHWGLRLPQRRRLQCSRRTSGRCTYSREASGSYCPLRPAYRCSSLRLIHTELCQRVELQPDNRVDRRGEGVEWAPVVGVEDSPVLEVGDDAFDDGADLVDGG